MLAALLRDVNAFLEPEPVADALLARVAEWLPAAGWLVVASLEGEELRPVSTRDLPEPSEAAARAVGDVAVKAGTAIFSANVAADPRLPDGKSYPAAACLALPLQCRGRTVGAVIGLDQRPSDKVPKLAAATLDAVRQALEPAAFALDNAMRMQRAEALTVTDDLTQLYNSRYLTQVLRREAKRSSRSGRPLSLLFIDLDGFKGVNDTHGHLAGSAALVEAAEVIRISARETDVVARFGGDEFSLILPDTHSEGAAMVAERIKEKIAVHAFLQKDRLNINLTVSVGVATLPDVASTAEQLVQAADEAMYWVKEHGKNAVRVARATDEFVKEAKSVMSATWAREERGR